MNEITWIWRFVTEDLERDDFMALGTEADAIALVAALANRGAIYKHSTSRYPICPKISDILTEMEISDAIANDF
jgi:hypothetical protein